MRQRKRVPPRRRRIDGDEGVAFVVCRICGDHRRVISGRHLSKHDTDRETYMEEYHLTPNELIAKDFRMIRSSRRGFYPHGKSDWIAAGDDLQAAAAVRAVFDVDVEDPFDQPGPTQARRRVNPSRCQEPRQTWTIPPSLDSHRKQDRGRRGRPAIGGNRWQQAKGF